MERIPFRIAASATGFPCGTGIRPAKSAFHLIDVVSRAAAKPAALLLGLLLTAEGLAQSALDGFDPGANFQVLSVAMQPDGRIIVGGEFNLLGGGGTGQFPRSRIGRLNLDGSLDTSFDPGANLNVLALAVLGDGSILVGGEFTMLGGGGSGTMPSNHLGLLDANGNLDPTFNPAPDNPVIALAIQPDGKILVAGGFTTIAGQTRNRIARLNLDGSLDNSFIDAGADLAIHAVALQGDGKILVGGEFNFLGGTIPRNKIGRLNPDGTVDLTFNPGADFVVLTLAVQPDSKVLVGGQFTKLGGGGTTPAMGIGRLNPDGSTDGTFLGQSGFWVNNILLQPDGKIVAGGQYGTLDGVPRMSIGRLNPDGSLDLGFNPGAGPGSLGVVFGLAMQPDARIVVVGRFNTLGGVGVTPREGIGRLYPDGALDDNFDPGADSDVITLAAQADGRILAGGAFTRLGSQGTTPRNRIGRINPDGTVDSSFDPNASDTVFTLGVQTDGKILLGGDFLTLNGGTSNRSRIARLNADGTVEAGFDPGADDTVRSLAVQRDGRIVLGGGFAFLGGGGTGTTPRNRVGRLNSDGTLDLSFDPNANGGVDTLAVQPDEKVLLGGGFTTLASGTSNRMHIARLNPDGTVDTNFDPGADDNVLALAVQPDGKILVGGRFTRLGGGTATTDRSRIGRLDPDGTVELSFDPGADGNVTSLSVQTDGKIVVVGDFTTLGDVGRNGIGRLNPDGSLDFTFDPGLNNGVDVRTSAVQSDGKLIVGGVFATFGGGTTPRSNIGRLTNTDAAFQELTAATDGTTITWSRGQASPELNRVTLEISTDGNSFAPLPDPTRIPGGWQLTGQSLLTFQNIFLRARGFFSTGGDSSSGSIVESVRNVFIASAPVIISPLSASAMLNQLFTYQITATNSPTSFNAVGLPAGLTVDTSTGLISGAPSVLGTFMVGLSASNTAGTGTAVLMLQVNPPAPVITSPLSASAIVSQPFTYQITATNSPTSFDAIGLPAGLTVDSTGLINGSPSLVGTYLVNLSATNAGGTGTAILTIDVTPPPPVILSPLVATATVDQQFIYQIIATQSPTSFDATNLPADFVIDRTLGIISGTPSLVDSRQVTLTASNAGGTDTAVLNLTVQLTPASGIIIISSTSATGRVGSHFSFQVITKGAAASARLSASGLPAGLNLDPQTGLISGTPTAEGSFSISLTVTDGNLTTMATLQLTFTSDSALPVITSSTSASLTPGQPFSYQIIAPSSDPDDPITYFLIGTLPNGLTFNSVTGTISGTFLGFLGSRPSPQLSGGIVTNVQLGATNSHGTTTIQFLFLLAPTGPQNISTRLAVGTDFDVLIGGFTITGNAPKKIIIRAIGPSLPVPGAIPDPTLELHSSTQLLGSNDNWRDTQEQEIIDTTISPTNELESAILAVLEPGAYTAIVGGKNNSTGVGLVEIYDLGTVSLDVSGTAQLVNISTRGKVQTADNVMIGGFILGGDTANVLVRAIGPELTASGVVGALEDTILELHDSTGALVASNDDWESNQKQEITDTTVPPTDPRESAIVSTLAPGAYTAIVRGNNGTIGVALVEAYLLP